jgi:hypothetical protein
VQKDIADLRRAQYEAQGQKTQVVEAREQGGSIGLWVGTALAILALLLTTYAITHRVTSPTPIIVPTPTTTTPSP